MRFLASLTTSLLLLAATAVGAHADRRTPPPADRGAPHAEQHGGGGEAAQRGGVPRGYRAAEHALGRAGRAAVRLLRAGDAAALHRRFAPALAAEVPLRRLRAILAELGAVAPIGAPVGETRLPLGRQLRVYAADLRWGDGTLDLDLAIDGTGAIAGFAVAPRRPLPPDPADRAVRLRLPLEGTWWTYWGGPDERRNYHVVAPSQRHAIDFVRWQRGGTARGDARRNEDFHAWGEPVVAPADGVVVAALDGVEDNRPRVEVANEEQPAGNHVVLDLGDGGYALLGHLRKGSVQVSAGDRVRASDRLGTVGNSGNSSEPHLHFHVQDGPDLDRATGLPVRFASVLVDGRPRDVAAALQGHFVAPAR